jgi:hypothetical protein
MAKSKKMQCLTSLLNTAIYHKMAGISVTGYASNYFKNYFLITSQTLLIKKIETKPRTIHFTLLLKINSKGQN